MICVSLAAVFAWGALPIAALAQSSGERNQAIQQLDRIQQEQQQRQERERQEQLDRQPRTHIEAPAPQEPENPGAAPCRDIKQIQIEGADLLAADDRQQLTAGYVGRCLTVSDIEQLLGEITAWYINRGYIGARAYIQTQGLEQGLLKVLVLEGQVESLRLEDGDEHSVNLTTAFPGVVGDPLNLRDLEQGLDQINRLSSNNATVALEPGNKPGDSVVVISNEASRRLHGALTYDNYGSDSTGNNQAGATVFLDNAARINDSAIATHRRTVGEDFGGEHSRSTSLLYSVPVGYLLVSASQVFSDYATTVRLPTSRLRATGDTDTSSLLLNYVAYRDQTNRVSLGSALTFRDTRNYLAGEKLQVSSRKVSSLGVTGSWSTRLLGGAITGRLGTEVGLKLFGAYEDPSNLPASAPHAQFLLWTAGLSWNRGFWLLKRPLSYSADLNAQWSDDALYGPEQILVGSIFSVRGFRDNSVSGSRGYYLRNELSSTWRRQLIWLPVSLRPYLGLDVGQIADRFVADGGTLSGVTAGLALTTRRLNVDLRASTAISQPSRFDNEGTQFYMNVGFNL